MWGEKKEEVLIDVKLLIADRCEHCIEAEKTLDKALQGLEEDISFETVNISKNLPEALHFKAAATPSVVINGKIEFIGQVDESQLRKRIAELI